MKNIKIIEVPSEIGAGTRGASLGIDAIKIAALDLMNNLFDHFPCEKIKVENNLLFEPIQSHFGKRIQGMFIRPGNVWKQIHTTVGNTIY
jgi:arginase